MTFSARLHFRLALSLSITEREREGERERELERETRTEGVSRVALKKDVYWFWVFP
jgi:hypothetical protein